MGGYNTTKSTLYTNKKIKFSKDCVSLGKKRKARGLLREDVASAVGVTSRTLHDFENGKSINGVLYRAYKEFVERAGETTNQDGL